MVSPKINTRKKFQHHLTQSSLVPISRNNRTNRYIRKTLIQTINTLPNITKVTSNANILLDGNFPLPNQLLSLSPTFSPTSPYWDELTLLGDAAPNPWIEVNKTGFAPQSPSITNLGIQWDRLGLAEGTVSADERHNFLTDLFDLRGSNNVEYLSHIRSQMQIFSLERYDGELSVRFQRFFGDSNNYVLFHIFEFVIYLTSNNVLSTNQIDHISKWIVKQKHEGVLRSCLKMQMPTTRAFAEKVLESALRIGDAHLLQLISDSEVDKRLLSGVHGGRHLRKAAKKGNVKIVQILLENGADINVPVCKEYNSTALHAAVIGGYVELVQLLLKAGANPNVPAYSELDSDKETPLSEAIRKRHAELVGVLVGAGANINLCTVDEDDGMEWAERNTDDQLYQILCTASGKDILPMTFDGIFKAASLDSQALSDYLNEKGADVKSNAKDKLEAALQAAADPDYFGGVNRDAVMSLLEIGVDPNAEPTDIWFKPILSAAGENDLELVEILLNASADANTLHALDRAAGPRDNLGLLTLLLDEGADIQTYGGEALEQAASHHNLEAVQFLLASGADVNAPIRSKGYRTPLQAATSDVELVRILIKAGADVNAYKSYYTGRTALQAAAYHRNIESVRELLKAGANVNAVGNPSDGFTALQVAAKWGNIDIVQILLDAGADVNAPGARVRGYTALQAACDIGNIKLIQILIDAGADVNAGGKRQSATMLQSAIKQGSFVLVKLLLMAGANANSPPRGIGGRSPIQEAAEKGNISLLELLLEAGADVNAAAGVEYGRTALQSAASAEKPNMELIEVLLKAGADISAPAGFKGGLTSLQGAAIRGHINLALRFLEAGADVNAAPATIDGRTALDGAAEYGHLDMVQMLLNSGARSDPSNDKRFGRPIELAEKNGHFAVAKLLESS
jgi:ankyrin repeat protein